MKWLGANGPQMRASDNVTILVNPVIVYFTIYWFNVIGLPHRNNYNIYIPDLFTESLLNDQM